MEIMRINDSLNNFLKEYKKIFMEMLLVQQHFPNKSSKFSTNSNCRTNLLLISRGLKRSHFGISEYAFFLFVAFFKL